MDSSASAVSCSCICYVKGNFAKSFLYLLGSYLDWLYHHTPSLLSVVLILKQSPKVLLKKCSLLSAQQILVKWASGGVTDTEVTWIIWRVESLKAGATRKQEGEIIKTEGLTQIQDTRSLLSTEAQYLTSSFLASFFIF